MKHVIGDYKSFIENIDHGLQRLGIGRDEIAAMDHVCYRVETIEQYRQMMTRIASIGELLSESEVNGRPIATFELNEYLQVAGWTVPYLELPAPKVGSPYIEGLEHAELVTIGSLDRFVQRHPELSFTYAGAKKRINPEIGLKAEGISVKFHEQQLGAVVRIESQLGVAG